MATNADNLAERYDLYHCGMQYLETLGLRGYDDYRFHVRPVPVFILNTCISAANRAARARKSRKRRSESGRAREGK